MITTGRMLRTANPNSVNRNNNSTSWRMTSNRMGAQNSNSPG